MGVLYTNGVTPRGRGTPTTGRVLTLRGCRVDADRPAARQGVAGRSGRGTSPEPEPGTRRCHPHGADDMLAGGHGKAKASEETWEQTLATEKGKDTRALPLERAWGAESHDYHTKTGNVS